MAVSRGGGLVVHHSDLDSLRISSDTQTDQRDLDDGKQELETQGAADTEEMVTVTQSAPTDVLPVISFSRYYY